MREPAIVDLDRFHLTAETQVEAQEVLEQFTRLTEEKLAQLTGAHPVEYWRRGAHYLKGCAANLGMNRLAAVCQAIEKSPPIAESDATQALDRIRREIAEIHSFFAAHPITFS